MDSSSKDLHEPGTFNRDRHINTQAPILSSILQSYRSTVISVASIHHTALVLSIGNLTMQPPMLEDGRELTPPASELDATCKAKEDEDYYLDLVTFEVKGKKSRAVLKKNLTLGYLSRLKIAYSASQAINSSKSLLNSARYTRSRRTLGLIT